MGHKIPNLRRHQKLHTRPEILPRPVPHAVQRRHAVPQASGREPQLDTRGEADAPEGGWGDFCRDDKVDTGGADGYEVAGEGADGFEGLGEEYTDGVDWEETAASAADDEVII
jgi:hypothetical protein